MVFFKLDDNSDFIPATESHELNPTVNTDGQASTGLTPSENAIVFAKPIMATRIRITLNDPMQKGSFSINTVQFFQKENIMLITNQEIDPSHSLCLFVNSNRATIGYQIEAVSCINAIATGSNRELWIVANDKSIRHFVSNYCIGFNQADDVVLSQCGSGTPSSYQIQARNDTSLYFEGYPDKSIYIDDSKTLSTNYIDASTQIVVTSQADAQTYKKENIKSKFCS